MTRFLVAFALALAAGPARAQDMPLSQILIDGQGWKRVRAPGPKPPENELLDQNGLVVPVARTHTPDGRGFFVAYPEDRYLYAGTCRADGTPVSKVAPYAPLRVRPGEKGIAVTSLETDRDGRIYAATDLGVQVFDPTGRLCGVLTPAAPGLPQNIAFEGDTLTLWIGDAKYARKLKTRGVEIPPPKRK